MTGKEIKAAISKYIVGQGSQAGLQGLSEILSAIVDHEDNIETQLSTIEVTISAYTQSNLTAEQAKQVGFTPEIVAYLMTAEHPTIRFSDWTITFNTYDHISEDLAIMTSVVYDAKKQKLYHSALYLYDDGRILYNVDEINATV